MNIEDFANEAPSSVRLGDITKSLQQIKNEAPIDCFLRELRATLQYGTPAQTESNDFIGRLLVLSIVSAAEGYFRSILSDVIEICPTAQGCSAEKNVQLGGVLWHGTSGYSRSVFEHFSFASAKELRKASKEFIGFDLKDAKFATPLEEFDRVCHIRHAVVHNGGVVPGKNALQLQIARSGGQQKLVIGYAQLQDIASVVATLVTTFNRELFFEMCRRWAVVWRARTDWDPTREDRLFSMVWANFHSREELVSRSGRTNITRKKCLEGVRDEFGL